VAAEQTVRKYMSSIHSSDAGLIPEWDNPAVQGKQKNLNEN
jgi:hypothetical protein